MALGRSLLASKSWMSLIANTARRLRSSRYTARRSQPSRFHAQVSAETLFIEKQLRSGLTWLNSPYLTPLMESFMDLHNFIIIQGLDAGGTLRRPTRRSYPACMKAGSSWSNLYVFPFPFYLTGDSLVPQCYDVSTLRKPDNFLMDDAIGSSLGTSDSHTFSKDTR